MLHSTLPRAFLPPPSLCYLGGYYGETVHPYSSVARFVPLENAYTSISHHAISPELSRSVSPTPLDLSLKPPPPPPLPPPPPEINEESETIEVDDVEDHQDGYKDRSYSQQWESNFASEEQQHSPSPISRSYVYEDVHQEQKIKSPSHPYPEVSEYRTPTSSPTNQKLHLASPTALRSIQDYQQQLLLTPQHHLQGIHAPMTPPSTPSPPQCPRRRVREDDDNTSSSINTTPIVNTPKSSTFDKTIQRPKKKHARRLKFDEDTSSPVSGTVILGPDEAVVTGDIDPAFNIVEVTEEARAELAKIENRLGPYQCKLCRQLHEDAFQLAQHRCSRIAHVEYRCPECDKRFSCPANLASHRRWHKPRIPPGENGSSSSTSSGSGDIPCGKCDAKFSRQAALRKHLVTQHPEANDNIPIVNNNNNNNNVEMETLEGMSSSKMTLPLGSGTSPEEIA